MIYAMSDIHGEYEKYLSMLELINFSDCDTLYVLGDAVDRGADPVGVLKDMASRPNVFPIMGNHDLMALDMLDRFNIEITEENAEGYITPEMMKCLSQWLSEGGDTTLRGFQKLTPQERDDLLSYMREFSLYAVIDVADRTFILTHSGLGNFDPGKKIKDYTPEELTFSRPDPHIRYFSDGNVFVVWGHTPTKLYSGKWEIYKSCGNICIDCGAAFSGRLACLCLDTLEEFYI